MAIINFEDGSLHIDFLANNLSFAREACGKTAKECSLLLGIPTSRLKNYEKGKHIPSLPEIETLSFVFRIPIVSFFKENGVKDHLLTPENIQVQKLIEIRQQIIGTRIHLAREKSKFSLQKFSKITSIPTSRIKRYEEGTTPIAMDELQNIVGALNLDLDAFFDHKSPLGNWQNNQSKNLVFEHLPENIKEFIADSNNLRYLILAHKLSIIGMDTLEDLSNSLSDFVEDLHHSEIDIG